jgi:hypothetical protein
VTLPTVAAAVAVACARGRKDLPIGLGLLLQIAYVVRVGGDF